MAELSWAALQAVWTIQTEFGDFRIDVDPFEGLVGGAFSAFLTTLVIGAILLAIAPRYTERLMGILEDDAVDTFVYGLVALVALVALTILLVITILGILLAIPLIVFAVLVWAVGAAIAYLLIGDRLVGHEDGWGKALLVGAGINGVLTITGIGGLLAFCIGAAGFGAVIRDWRA